MNRESLSRALQWVSLSMDRRSMLIATLRSVLVIHSLTLLSQSVFAGQFLSGTDGIVKFHEWGGWLILAVCAIQIGLVAVLMRFGAASWWLLIGSIFVLLAEGLQTGTGYGRFLRVHIPLGTILFGVVSFQAISMFRNRMRHPGFVK